MEGRIAEQTFRALLAMAGPRIGLTPVAIDALVGRSQLTWWRKGQRIFSGDDSTELVNFLVTGFVKVTCQGLRSRPVVIQYVKPGRFFGLNWFLEPHRPRLFTAWAFTDAVVAVMTSDVISCMLASLPPRSVVQLLSYSWRALSRLLYEKCLYLSMNIEQRLLHELRILAREFGVDRGEEVLLNLPLSHQDLAELIAGSRANVTRALGRLKRKSLVRCEDRRFLLSQRLLPSAPAAIEEDARDFVLIST